jgi:hypothetical protein
MQKFPQLLATCVAAVMATSAFALTPAEHKAEKDRISADYKAAVAHCKTMNGNAKDVCEKEAKGHEKVALAELDYKKDASESNRYKAAKARADAGYDVATEKCDDQSGNAKDVCKKDAKAAHVKALEAARWPRSATSPTPTLPPRLPMYSRCAERLTRMSVKRTTRPRPSGATPCPAMPRTSAVTDAKRRFGQ